MANVLKIKSRQTGAAGAPSSLDRAELAYDELGEVIYIGHGTGTDATRSKNAIGGVGAFVDKGTAQTITGAKTMSSSSNAFTGDGSALTNLNATQLLTGTVPVGRLDSATTTTEGIVELATDAETNTGTNATRAVTPAGLTAWTGDTNLVTVGTITNGTWSGTKLVAGKVPNLEDLTVGGHIGLGNNYRITGLGAPVAPNDAARKTDVDAAVQGLDVRDSVRVISVSDIPNPTSTQSSAFTVDDETLAAGDRILLQNQSPSSENGIYEVTYASSSWSMSRSADLFADADCSPNMFFFVEEGTSYADTGWVCTTNGTVTTANLVFAQFSGTGTYAGGSGIDLTGTTFTADLKTNGGLTIESGKIAVNLEASSITGTLPITEGGTGATSDSAARTSLGVAIGSDVQAYDAGLADIAGLTPTNNEFIVGNGSNFDMETPSQARTSLGLGTMATQASTAVSITGGTITMNSSQAVTIDCGTF